MMPVLWGLDIEAKVIRAVGHDDGGFIYVYSDDVRKIIDDEGKLKELSEKTGVGIEKLKSVLMRILRERDWISVYEVQYGGEKDG